MAELGLNKETVQGMIDMAHEFHAQDDMTLAEEPEVADEYWADQVSADFSADPYYHELKNTIDDLEPDQQISLVALVWLGRGDFSIKEWPEALGTAAENWNKHTANYLIGTSLLADYLAEGLQIFEAEDAD